MAIGGVVADAVLYLQGLTSAILRRPPRLREIIASLYAVLDVAWKPVVAVAFPIGMTFALNYDGITSALGMRSMASGGLAPAIIREAGPLFAGLLTATTAGAAFCADIGARKVRDELDASEVMAVDPRTRLFAPRVAATTIGTVLLAYFGSFAGLLGGWFTLVVLRGEASGSFRSGFQDILRLEDLAVLTLKGFLFGLVIGLTATFMGSRATGGPSGVADATRRTIIVCCALLVVVGFLVNQAFYGTGSNL